MAKPANYFPLKMDTSLEMQLAQALLEIFPELTLTKDAGTGVLTIGTAQLVLTINSGGTLQEGREVGTAYSNLKSGLALGTVGAGVLGVVGALGAGAVATGHAAGQAIGRGIEAMRPKPAPVDTTTSYQVRGRQADGTLREMSTAGGSGSFEGPVNETTGMPLGASPKPAYTSPDKTGVPVMSHPVKQGLSEGNVGSWDELARGGTIPPMRVLATPLGQLEYNLPPSLMLGTFGKDRAPGMLYVKLVRVRDNQTIEQLGLICALDEAGNHCAPANAAKYAVETRYGVSQFAQFSRAAQWLFNKTLKFVQQEPQTSPGKEPLLEGNGETGPNFPISGPEVVPDGAKWEVKVTATGQRTKTWTLENEQIALFYFKGTNPNTGGAARLYKDGKMVKIKRG